MRYNGQSVNGMMEEEEEEEGAGKEGKLMHLRIVKRRMPFQAAREMAGDGCSFRMSLSNISRRGTVL